MIRGSIREKPEINIEPFVCSLRKTSKLAFIPKEQVERILMRNLTFNGKHKRLQIDREKCLEMLRDVDVHSSRKKFTEIRSKLIIPETMLDSDIEA